MTKKLGYLLLLISLLLILSSCATVPVRPPETCSKGTLQANLPILRNDITHIVAPGETLWRISKMYDVPIQNIAQANNLKDEEKLVKGQRLFIPAAAPIAPVISLYPSKKWKYIIIHHSATDEGNSLFFDRYHLKKGWEGVGYHFVIDNGSKEKQDGQIEVSPRWLNQKNGAHCNVDNMNERSIGICLVGNFNNEIVSAKQMTALVYLTDRLRKYYKIPPERIIGHGQVRGAKTYCPGNNFPWKDFKERLMAIK